MHDNYYFYYYFYSTGMITWLYNCLSTVFSGIQSSESWYHCSKCGDNGLRFLHVYRFHHIDDDQIVAKDVPRETDIPLWLGRRQVSYYVVSHGNRWNHRTVLLYDERRDRYLCSNSCEIFHYIRELQKLLGNKYYS